MQKITMRKYREFLLMGNFLSCQVRKVRASLMPSAGTAVESFVQWVLNQERNPGGMIAMTATGRSRGVELRIKRLKPSVDNVIYEDMHPGDMYYRILGENGVFLVHDYANYGVTSVRYVPYPGNAENYI